MMEKLLREFILNKNGGIKLYSYFKEIKNKYFSNHTDRIEQHKGIIKLVWADKNKKSDYDITYIFEDKCIYNSSEMGDIAVKVNETANLNTIDKYPLGQFVKNIIYREDKKDFTPEAITQTIDEYINENPGMDETNSKFLYVVKSMVKRSLKLNDWVGQVSKMKRDYGLTPCHYVWLNDAGDKYYNKTFIYWAGLKIACKEIKNKAELVNLRGA